MDKHLLPKSTKRYRATGGRLLVSRKLRLWSSIARQPRARHQQLFSVLFQVEWNPEGWDDCVEKRAHRNLCRWQDPRACRNRLRLSRETIQPRKMVSYSLRPKQAILNKQQFEIISSCFLFLLNFRSLWAQRMATGRRGCGGGRCRREGV